MNNQKQLYEMRELTPEEAAERDALYLELGRAYYEGAFEDPLPQLLPLFDRLTRLLKAPEKANLCPSCGTELEEGDMFCPECGYRLVGEPEFVPEPAPRELICPNCGKVLGPGAKFCGGCGTRIG